ncbi:hypothetical protein [Sulfurimonas sp.]
MDSIDIGNIQLFKKYIEENKEFFQDELHIPYFIGSPSQVSSDRELGRKNDALIPLVVLASDKYDEPIFKEVYFNWYSIDLLKTYYFINTNGQIEDLEQKAEYKKFFFKDVIDVDIQDVSELKLEDVINTTSFYNKLSTPLKNKYKNESFLKFKSDDITYIIPAIEVVRYFYCNSVDDSLKKAIFHPSGLQCLVRDLQLSSDDKYTLHLETCAKHEDNKKIFYFYHDEDYKKMFSSIYHNYRASGVLKAEFPLKNNFSMACRMFSYPRDPSTVLILQVIDSSMINNFFTDNNIELYVTHPQIQSKEEKTGKQDGTKNKKKKVPKATTYNFDDSISALASLSNLMVEDSSSEIYFPEEEKTANIIKNKQREEKGEETSIQFVEVNGLSTTNGSTTKNTQSAIKVTVSKKKVNIIQKYPSDIMPLQRNVNINDSSNIIQHFKAKKYHIASLKTFSFPDRIDGRKLVISYTDSKKTKKRSYILIKFTKKQKTYTYIDVEERIIKEDSDKGTKKEVLILVNKKDEIAHKAIYQQVHHGNHKWFSIESLGLNENSDFFRIRHREAEALVEAIHEKIAGDETI